MAVNDNDEFFAILEGTEKIAKLIYRYAIFENIYLNGAHSVKGKARGELEKAVKHMYKAMLLYLFRARRYYSQTVKSMAQILSFYTHDYDIVLI